MAEDPQTSWLPPKSVARHRPSAQDERIVGLSKKLHARAGRSSHGMLGGRRRSKSGLRTRPRIGQKRNGLVRQGARRREEVAKEPPTSAHDQLLFGAIAGQRRRGGPCAGPYADAAMSSSPRRNRRKVSQRAGPCCAVGSTAPDGITQARSTWTDQHHGRYSSAARRP